MGKVHTLNCDSLSVGAALEPFSIPRDSAMSAWMAEVLRMPSFPGAPTPPLESLDQEHMRWLSLPRFLPASCCQQANERCHQ